MGAGGVPKFIALAPRNGKSTSSRDWTLDPEELASLFNSKTKAIIFNNPNNPLGKVVQREEIEEIANLCKKHNVLVISDDVYERTITIGSAGKTFSVTGWKLGWALGPEHLLQ